MLGYIYPLYKLLHIIAFFTRFTLYRFVYKLKAMNINWESLSSDTYSFYLELILVRVPQRDYFENIWPRLFEGQITLSTG